MTIVTKEVAVIGTPYRAYEGKIGFCVQVSGMESHLVHFHHSDDPMVRSLPPIRLNRKHLLQVEYLGEGT